MPRRIHRHLDIKEDGLETPSLSLARAPHAVPRASEPALHDLGNGVLALVGRGQRQVVVRAEGGGRVAELELRRAHHRGPVGARAVGRREDGALAVDAGEAGVADVVEVGAEVVCCVLTILVSTVFFLEFLG